MARNQLVEATMEGALDDVVCSGKWRARDQCKEMECGKAPQTTRTVAWGENVLVYNKKRERSKHVDLSRLENDGIQQA